MATYTIDKIEYSSNVYNLQDNVSGYITGISSSDVTTALGFTPLSSSSTLDATKLSGTIPSGCYTDTNTTYTLSNALASHKFTSTLTAGGSGSGTSTVTMEFVAGTGITLTDDTTNKKITIASSLTVPTITLNGSSTTSPSFYAPTSAGTSGYVLTSSGSGAPSWTSGSLTDQNVLQTLLDNNDQEVYHIVLCDASSATVTSGVNKSGHLTFDAGTNALTVSGSGSISAHTVEGAYLIVNNGLTISKGASPWYEATITASNITANRSYSLPNNSGTFALTSDVFSSTTASLTTSGWSSNSQTVSVTGVTASNTVIVSPAPASYDAYCEAGIYCSAQGAGTLTFTCNTTPSSALTVNILYK